MMLSSVILCPDILRLVTEQRLSSEEGHLTLLGTGTSLEVFLVGKTQHQLSDRKFRRPQNKSVFSGLVILMKVRLIWSDLNL